MQVFSSTRDAFIDFSTKYEPSKPLQDANRLRVLQMGHESSLQVYNGKIVVNRKGHVGIGVVQPTHILHVDGQIRSSMSTIATASDIRLKTHITPVSQTESLETILNLTVRDYTWKKDGRRQRGFIAQEVEKIIPSAVQKVNETEGQHNIEDLRLLNLDPIIVELVGAVQAPASRIDKKSSPENCIFFLPIRFHLTLILELQRRNACPIILLPRNSCMNTICFFFNFRLDILIGLKIKFDVRHRNVQK